MLHCILTDVMLKSLHSSQIPPLFALEVKKNLINARANQGLMSRLPVNSTIGSVWLRAKTELHKKVKLAVFSIKTVHLVYASDSERSKRKVQNRMQLL